MYGTFVWTGRALEAEDDDLEMIGLARFCIRPLNGAFVLPAIVDIAHIRSTANPSMSVFRPGRI